MLHLADLVVLQALASLMVSTHDHFLIPAWSGEPRKPQRLQAASFAKFGV